MHSVTLPRDSTPRVYAQNAAVGANQDGVAGAARPATSQPAMPPATRPITTPSAPPRPVVPHPSRPVSVAVASAPIANDRGLISLIARYPTSMPTSDPVPKHAIMHGHVAPCSQ